MAELEVAKHGKNVIHLMGKKEHALAHRLREIAIEIAIIVFAVSMSIWLHGLSEHYHQQQEVRTFLVGLRADLKDDAADGDAGRLPRLRPELRLPGQPGGGQGAGLEEIQ
jgi:hypothetical protein